jgi:hypothetical protein
MWECVEVWRCGGDCGHSLRAFRCMCVCVCTFTYIRGKCSECVCVCGCARVVHANVNMIVYVGVIALVGMCVCSSVCVCESARVALFARPTSLLPVRTLPSPSFSLVVVGKHAKF